VSEAFEVPSGLPNIVTLAIQLWGEPTSRKPGEVRFGTNGSKSVKPAPVNTWRDHESDEGGGYVKLYELKYGKMPAQTGFSVPPGMAKELGQPIAWWDYQNELSSTVARVVRFHPPGREPDPRTGKPAKEFRQCKPDGDRWKWKLDGLKIPLYHLPELIAAPDGTTVLITEGEKKADQLRSWGLIATTNAAGAKKFRPDHAATLARFDCVVVPDNDDAGRDHAQVVTKALWAAGCASVRILKLPNLPPKGDIVDWVKAGGTAEAFAALLDALAPDAPADPAPDDSATWNLDMGPEPPPGFDDPSYQAAVDADPQAPKPTIEVIAGKIAQTTTIAEQALIDSGIPLYQRGQSLVRPAMQEVPASKGRLTIAACFAKLTRPGAVDIMARAAIWTKFDGRSKRWAKIDPPPAIADVLLSRFGEWTFPTVKGVITTPTLRPDYSILSEPGYDKATRLYLMPDKTLVMPDIPEHPTKKQAAEAIELLDALLVGFPFVSDVDRSVALSALITPVCRGAMAVSPLHAFRANTAGTGKSFIADVASAITSSRPCPVISAGRNMDEMDKRLVGLLLSGSPILSIDNVNGSIGSDLLCQAAERPLLRLRGLGKSDIIEVESNATIFANGSGFAVEGDMTRRTLVSDLDAEEERPELRTFDFDPVERVLANRGKYVAAALTVVRAFVQSGKKPDIPPLASYGDYTNAVRGALVWLGKADPAESMERAREDDPELSALRAVMAQWTHHIGLNVEATAKAFIQRAELHQRDDETARQLPEYLYPELRDVLLSIAPGRQGIDSAKFGYWLRAKKGRITTLPGSGRVRFEPAGATNGLARWKLAAVPAKGPPQKQASPEPDLGTADDFYR
jgi:putative DNA primase/helicase